jgi:drug/metabolite transporter (DMT)-like permease
MSTPEDGSPIVGLIAAFAVVVIGAGWYVATRLGVTTSLHPVDLAVLRYGAPALMLAPVLIRTGLIPQGMSFGTLTLMVMGAGLPFGLVAMIGSRFAPVVHMGVLVPGGMALGVAVLAHFILKERFSALRRAGLAILAVAVGLLFVANISVATSGSALGDTLFLCAAILWAFYTIAYRRSGLSPFEAAAVISAWSLILVAPLWLATPGTRLMTAPFSDITFQFLWQSVLAGVVAMYCYGAAVRNIGPSSTTAFAALTPVASSLGGYFVLGETISSLAGIAIGLCVIGVFLSAGWLDSFQQ